MKWQVLPILLYTAALLFIGLRVDAQIIGEPSSLIYIRQRDETGFQLVSLSPTGRHVFQLALDDCYQLSPGLNYLALSHPERREIDVYRLRDRQHMILIPLESAQSGCYFDWRNETVLNLISTTHPLTIERGVDILDGSILPAETQPLAEAPATHVPNLFSGDFRLASPDLTKLVYSRCTDVATDELTCSSDGEIVIYDLSTRQVLQVLEDAHQRCFSLDPFAPLTGFGGIDWSPSGRYLVYRLCDSQQENERFHIYDIQEQRYFTLELPPLTEMNRMKAFRWFPDEQQVAFWVNDYEMKGIRLAIADTNSGQVQLSDLISLAQAGWTVRSDKTIAFVDRELNLVEYHIDTGAVSILDTEVWDILNR